MVQHLVFSAIGNLAVALFSEFGESRSGKARVCSGGYWQGRVWFRRSMVGLAFVGRSWSWSGSVWFFMNDDKMSAFPKTLALLAQEQWKAIVEAYRAGVTAEDLAREAGSNPSTVRQKYRAIHWKHETDCDFEAIIAAGQGPTLSSYAKARKNGHEKEKVLRWRVPASLADCIQNDNSSPDAEEALITRLHRVLGLETSEDFWMFIHSWFGEVSDAALLHHAGEGKMKKRR